MLQRSLSLLLAAAFAASPAWADLVSERVTIQSKFYSHYDYDTLDVTYYGPDGSENWQHSGYVSTSSPRPQEIVPGREYFVVLSGIDSGDNYDLFFTPPEGHDMYIAGPDSSDYTRRSHVTWETMGTSAHTFRFKIEARDTLAGYGGFGEASSWAEDRPVWQIDLGSLRSGDSAGKLEIRADSINDLNHSPSDLVYVADSPEVEVVKSGGQLRQIKTPQGLADIEPVNSTSYSVDLYGWASVGSWNGSTYDVSGTPLVEYVVAKVSSPNAVDITKTVGSTTWKTRLQEVSSTITLYDWVLGTNPTASLRKVETSVSTSLPDQTRITTVFGRQSSSSSWVASSRTRRIYTTYGSGSGEWGPVLTQKTVGYNASGTTPATTNYVYYTSSSDVGNYRRLKEVQHPDGGKTLYEYHASEGQVGLLKKLYEPFQDANPAFGSTAAKVTEYQYSGADHDGERKPVMVETKIGGKTVRKTDYDYSAPSSSVLKTVTKDYYHDQADGADGNNLKHLTTTSWSYLNSVSDGHLRGKPYAVLRPDGSKTRYHYYIENTQLVSRVFHGYDANPGHADYPADSMLAGPGSSDEFWTVAKQSTMNETITDIHGRVMSETSWVNSSGTNFEGLQTKSFGYDSSSNLTSVTQGGNTLYSATYVNGRLASETDEAGATKEYSYDSAERVDLILEKGKAATTAGGAGYDTDAVPDRRIEITYDGSNRETARTVRESPSGEAIVSSFSYDLAGRLISKTMDCCDTVTYDYDPALGIVHTENPDGGTIVEDYYRDGSLYSRTGTATTHFYRRSAVMTPTDQLTVQTAQEYFSGIGGTPVVAGRKISRYDWLGRQTSEAVVNDEGYSTITEYEYEHPTGRLVARHLRKNYGSDPIVAPHRYGYNVLGQVEYEGLDVDNDGVPEGANFSDRVTRRIFDFYKDGSSRWWARTRSYAFPTSDSPGVKFSEERSRVTPVANELGRVLALDVNSNVTQKWAEVNRSHGIVALKSQLQPASASAHGVALELSKLGLKLRQQDPAGNVQNFKYDALWRLKAEIGRDNVYREYFYHSGTQRVKEIWNRNGGSGGYAAHVFTYANARVATETRRNNFGSGAVDEIISYQYNPRGQVTKVSGSGSYPIDYEYDAYGRLKKQTQIRDTGKLTVTEWGYNTANGLLKWKKHAGSASYQELYDYNELHAIKKRTLARGKYTDYLYSKGSAKATGDLLDEKHSDSTPDVKYREYDRMGRLTKVADYTGGSINSQGEITINTQNRVFSYADNSGLSLSNENLPDSFYKAGAAYDFAHSYESAGSGKVAGRHSGFDYASVSWGQGYEALTGRLSSVSTSATSSPTYSRSFAYEYDDDSNHVASVSSGSYGQYRYWEGHRENYINTTTKWGTATRAAYNVAALSWQYQVMSYDLSNPNSDSLAHKIKGGTGSISYAMTYDAVGQLKTWDTNRTTPDPDRSYSWDGAGNPTNYGGTSLTPNDFNQLDEFSYDEDGNLTMDSDWRYWDSVEAEWKWGYRYDANNRLVQMRSSENDKSLEFVYDYMGRRVEKKVWSNKSFSGTPDTHLKFAYQGMELVAELDSAGGLRKTFHWGLDKSDTRGGAGGAMGLVMWRDHVADASYFPAYDLNGNVTGLLGEDGQFKAWYEYDAFGKVVTEGGTMKDANPIRFSTQYTDDETGLVYYGFRYYDPSKGRFLNRDPIGEAGGANLYRFVDNNPVSRVDVWGLNTVRFWSLCADLVEVEIFTQDATGRWKSSTNFACSPGWVEMQVPGWGDYVNPAANGSQGGGGSIGGSNPPAPSNTENTENTDPKEKLSEKRCQELAKFIKGRNNLAQHVGNRLADEYQSLTGETSGSLVDAFRTVGSYVGNGATAITIANEVQALLPASEIHMRVGSFTQRIDSGGARGSWLNNKAGSYIKGAGNAAAAVSFGFNVSDGYQSYQNGNIAGTVNSSGKAASDVMSTFVPITAPIFMGGNMIDADLKRRMAAFEMNHRLDVFSQDMNSLKSHLNVASGYLDEFQAGGCDGSLLE